MAPLTKAQREELKKKLLWTPCKSEEELNRFVKVFFGIELPNTTVDPISNTNPSQLLWEVYEAMLTGKDLGRLLFYAARDSFKTVLSSIIESLAILHCGRDVAHMAAVESQSLVCRRYLRNYFNKPYLAPYVSQSAERRVEITKYVNKDTGEVIPKAEFDKRLKELEAVGKVSEMDAFEEQVNFIQIVICTMQGANSLHASLLILDELDLADPGPVNESKMIPTPVRNKGWPPITLMTSSRKFSVGLVQKEIDDAEETGLHIRHWNIIDVSQSCPQERSLSDLPKIPIYVEQENLKAIDENGFEKLPPEMKDKYEKCEGYVGCMENCKLFAACRGRLVDGQKSTSVVLKDIRHVQTLFRSLPADIALAQLLCHKPSSFGLVYQRFNAETHCKTAAEMANLITGENYPETMGKTELINLMLSRGLRMVSGLDHGYTHNFAVVSGAVDGSRCFIVDVISAPELELAQKIEVMTKRIRWFAPMIYPDPEDPASNKTIKRFFKVKEWQKTPGSVVGGIEIVRLKLTPGTDKPPELYLLKGDDGCAQLAKDMSKYHWKIDTEGEPTDIPNDKDDDRLDALRYLIMNVFPPTAGRAGSKGGVTMVTQSNGGNKAYSHGNYLSEILADLTGGDLGGGPSIDDPFASSGQVGGIRWSF
jgi:hypothetical protein